jgi:cytochrome c biogenesis protein
VYLYLSLVVAFETSSMATQTRKKPVGARYIAPASPTRTGNGRRNPPPPRGSRFRQRLLFILRHPVDAVWGWLSAVRTAILLITLITLICLLGIYFVQAPGEVLGDSTAYAGWVQQNAIPRYGSLTPIFNWMQFFTIFSSWYFLLLLTILALSIVVCTLNRAPAIWQNFKHPVIRRSEKFYQNALERADFSRPDALAWTRAEFRRRGFRVRSQTAVSEEDGDGEITYLYANKNSWATLSTFVFHAALVTLLLAGVVSQWHGFPADSPARRFLPAPLINLTDNLAGFTFDQALPDGQSAVVYPRGTPHNISFRANSFTATFDPKTGIPTDYVTDLSVYKDGVLVAHSNHLRVNDPLSYDGIIFHQSSLIPSVTITLSDKQGCFVCAQPVVLDQTGTVNGLQVDFASGVPIAGSSMSMSVLFPHVAGTQLAQVAHPVFLVSIGNPGAAPTTDKLVARLSVGEPGYSYDRQWTVVVNSAKEATVLLVTKDSGSSLIWPTAVILILSLCATFYFPQRRIWIRIQGQGVQMAALREHFVNIRTDLLGVAKQAAASPLTIVRN